MDEERGRREAGTIQLQQTHMAITCAKAGEWQCKLSQEVITRGIVVILHYEANQGEVRDMNGKVKGAVPARVETIVVHMIRFLLNVVDGNSVNLNPHLRVHYGTGFVTFWFGKLLG